MECELGPFADDRAGDPSMPPHPVSVLRRRLGKEATRSNATLLFCHATGFCKEMWAPVMDELELALPPADAYDALALDFTGHGDSRLRVKSLGHPARPLPPWYDWCPMDVMESLDRVSGSPCIGIGHSMGAGALVHTELRHPGTFSALILLEPILPPPPEAGVLVTARPHLVVELRRSGGSGGAGGRCAGHCGLTARHLIPRPQNSATA